MTARASLLALLLLLMCIHTTLATSVEPCSSSPPPQTVILSWSPRIILVENFMSISECSSLIEAHSSDLEPSSAFGSGDDLRTSSTKWLIRADEANPSITKTVVDRIHNFTMLPNSHGETLQIVKYGPGEKYEFHHDSDRRMARLATALVYLTDVEEGGETIFPFVQVNEGPLPMAVDLGDLISGIQPMTEYCASDQFLKITPKAGSLLIFYSMLPDLNIDELAWHGACPVIKGEKIAAQRWIKYMADPSYESEIASAS